MRFLTYRAPLAEQLNAVPIPNFARLLRDTYTKATKDVEMFRARKRIQPGNVAAWQEALHVSMFERFPSGSIEADVVLGIHVTMVGEYLLNHSIRGPLAFGLCVDGQQRLTRVIMSITVDDRDTLMRPTDRNLRQCLFGALAVARLAAALNMYGAQAYLPKLEDDRSHGIDLLVKRENKGACVQVKAAKQRTLVTRADDPDSRIMRGIALFNQKYASNWKAINVDLVLRRTAMSNLGCDDANRAAQRVLDIMEF